MFSQFNPGCCCTSTACRTVYYPQTTAPGYSMHEAWFIHALNVPSDEEFYEPITDTWQLYTSTPGNLGKLDEVGIIIMTSVSICNWKDVSFGYDELIEYIRRGNSVVIAAEHASGCFGLDDLAIVNDWLLNLGSPIMTVIRDSVYSGCQTIHNYANDVIKSNLNWNIPTWGLGGSSLLDLSGGSSHAVVMDNDSTVFVGACLSTYNTGNNGKIILMGDNNMLNSCATPTLDKLFNNICKAKYSEIFMVDGEWTPSDY